MCKDYNRKTSQSLEGTVKLARKGKTTYAQRTEYIKYLRKNKFYLPNNLNKVSRSNSKSGIVKVFLFPLCHLFI